LEAAVTELIRAAQRPLHDGTVRRRADVVAVVRERAAFWGALADDDGRTWTLDVSVPAPTEVDVDADDLGAALDAVLDNVFTHTPEGTAYAVTVAAAAASAEHGRAVLVRVDDAGPGIADAELLARGRTSADERSTGLGLDIARQAATELRVGPSALGGTSVTLTLAIPGVGYES
jgi:signal transduction histidine kinase